MYLAIKMEHLKAFRLTCRRFYAITLSKEILEKIAINLLSIMEEDLHNVFKFLEHIGYGKFIRFILVDHNYNDTSQKTIEFAKNLTDFKGNMLTRHLVNCCPLLNTLILLKHDWVHHNVATNVSYLKSFQYLETLEIYVFKVMLPITILDDIIDNSIHLKSLGFNGITFIQGDRERIQDIVVCGVSQATFFVKETSILHWMFKKVKVNAGGFIIMLPTTAVSIIKLDSPHILWDSKTTRLFKLELSFSPRDMVDDEYLFPANVEHFSLTCDHWSINNLSKPHSVEHTKDYKSLLLNTEVTSSVIQTVLCLVNNMELAKLHLICRSGFLVREHCSEKDIIELLTFYTELKVLVLEKFHVTLGFIQLLSSFDLKLQLLRLINCKGFNDEEIARISDNNIIKFKIFIGQYKGYR